MALAYRQSCNRLSCARGCYWGNSFWALFAELPTTKSLDKAHVRDKYSSNIRNLLQHPEECDRPYPTNNARSIREPRNRCRHSISMVQSHELAWDTSRAWAICQLTSSCSLPGDQNAAQKTSPLQGEACAATRQIYRTTLQSSRHRDLLHLGRRSCNVDVQTWCATVGPQGGVRLMSIKWLSPKHSILCSYRTLGVSAWLVDDNGLTSRSLSFRKASGAAYVVYRSTRS